MTALLAPLAATNPFDPKTALFAKHAQHVVLIHFPIALYLAGTFFDVGGRFLRRGVLSEAARWNFLGAALMTLPAATGLLAWHFALEGQRLKGLLRLHFLLAGVVVLGTWATVWLRRRPAPRVRGFAPNGVLILEFAVSAIIAITAHVGGFLSGVNR